MANSESNKPSKSSTSTEMTTTQCFQCGQDVELPAIRLEAMDVTGQDVYCRNCDEEANVDAEDIDFIPFFE